MEENPWLTEILGLRIDNPRSEGVRRFLVGNGFITIDDDGPAACVFQGDGGEPSMNRGSEAVSVGSLPGIERVYVVPLSARGSGVESLHGT